MQEALRLLKQQAELQPCGLSGTFAPFRYHAASPSSNWSIRLLPGQDSCCYVLRQDSETALLNPRLETLQRLYSPALQEELERSELVVFPTPSPVVRLSLRLEQVQAHLQKCSHSAAGSVRKHTRFSKKRKSLEHKKQYLQTRLENEWSVFSDDLLA
ncbi:MAG: hypothetical protein AAF975_07920, partial [Spirochaetota bacterium]